MDGDPNHARPPPGIRSSIAYRRTVTQADGDTGTRPDRGLGPAWLIARLAPVGLLALIFAVALGGTDLASRDRTGFAAAGFGSLGLAALCWILRWRNPDQETIAGAARVATIVAVIVVLSLIAVGGSH